MRIISIVFAGFIVLLAPACSKPLPGNSGTNPATAASLLNIAYGTNDRQKMDIYLPAGRSADSTKMLLLIHGGGWTEGDKADFTSAVSALQLRFPAYAFANINYRLVANGQNRFPTQEEDVKAAVAFLFSKRNDYHFSDKWAFLGASAGAHLAMLQGYKYSSPVKAQAVISFFGPADLTSLYNSSPVAALLLFNVTGTTPVLNPAIYQQSGPINFITAQSAPTLLLQGGTDPIVPPVQSTLVRDKLQQLGVASQYVFYADKGHGWDGPELLDSFDKITAFLTKYMH